MPNVKVCPEEGCWELCVGGGHRCPRHQKERACRQSCAWTKAHREQINEHRKYLRHNNPEYRKKLLDWKKEWIKKKRATDPEWYQKHLSKLREKAAIYRQTHPEKAAEYIRRKSSRDTEARIINEKLPRLLSRFKTDEEKQAFLALVDKWEKKVEEMRNEER